MDMRITCTLRQIEMTSHNRDVLQKRLALGICVSLVVASLAPRPALAATTESDWDPVEKAKVVTFPTRDFYIHAPPFKLRLADIGRFSPKTVSLET